MQEATALRHRRYQSKKTSRGQPNNGQPDEHYPHPVIQGETSWETIEKLEGSLLGTIIAFPEVIEPVQEKLAPPDFRNAHYRAAYKIILQWHQDDPDAVSAELLQGRMRAVTNAETVATIVYHCSQAVAGPPAIRWAEYLRRVAVIRRVIDATGQRLEAMTTVDASLDEAYPAILELSTELQDDLKRISQKARYGPQPIACLASEIEQRDTTWLWEPWIPIGSITLFDGRGGIGKSTLVFDLMARLSCGWGMPDQSFDYDSPPFSAQTCIYIGAEDSARETIAPRLQAAGANMDRIVISHSVEEKERRPYSFPADLPVLERLIEKHGASVVVIDPLNAFTNADVDTHRDADVRRLLFPLAELAERARVAVVPLRHTTKDDKGAAVYRGLGSVGYTNSARAVLFAGNHPKHRDRYGLAVAKLNLAVAPRALEYQLDAIKVAGLDKPVSRVKWLGQSDITADDISRATCGTRKSPATDAAKLFLLGLLSGGERWADEILGTAKNNGISRSVLHRAADQLGVVKRPSNQFQGKYAWSLPSKA